jgi:hypothetical protein
MGAVDDSHYSLVIAAAQAAGPCPVGEEAAWSRRVHGLTVDLHLRTEQKDTDRGQALIERARALEGRWVLVYRYNERKTGQRNQSVRMLAHLMDLGVDGAVPSTAAKKMVLQEAGGDVARAQQAWAVAGLPGSGPVSVDQLERARMAARETG